MISNSEVRLYIRYSVIILILSLSRIPVANAGTGNGGSLRLLKACHPSARMIRESIRFYFDESDISALIDYGIKNEGPPQMMMVAFPENNYIGSKLGSLAQSGLDEFRVHVDGARVHARRQVIDRSQVHPEPNALWIFKMPLRRDQVCHVRVRYRASVWGSCITSTNYMFGDKWKGVTAQRNLTIVDCSAKGDMSFETGLPLRRKGRRYHHRWTNAKNLGTLAIATI